MYGYRRRLSYLVALLAVMVCLCACGGGEKVEEDTSTLPVDLNVTVDSLAVIYQLGAIPVRGFGLVANLPGTGSGDCPPLIREAMIKQIHKEIPGDMINPGAFINSPDTAVVQVTGVIPALGFKGEVYDVFVKSLPGSQTTSIATGRLYTTELKVASAFPGQYTKTIGKAAGPIFIDRGDGDVDERSGYILGGGMVEAEVKVSLAMKSPNFMAANAIRNRLNERFGPNTAKAISPAEIELNIPEQYAGRKRKFLSIVRALYLSSSASLQRERVNGFVKALAKEDNKAAAENGLLAIGTAAIGDIRKLLNSDDEQVRFYAGRCILELGNSQGLRVLRDILNDKKSEYRIGAVKAIGELAKRNDALAALSPLLVEEDFDVRLAVYEQLRRLDHFSISRALIAGDFFVDTVITGGKKVVYATRRGEPRIVIFASPVYCKKDLFIESADGNVTINARPGEKFVSLMRKHPRRPNLIGPMPSTFELTDIIRTLCDPIATEKRPGLGISYDEALDLLKIICEIGAVDVEFLSGPLPDERIKLEKRAANDR